MTPPVAIAQRFGCRAPALRTDLTLPGSPQRCRSRVAVQETDGRTWVLEELGESQALRREHVARLLMALRGLGLPVPEFRHAPDGAYVMRHQGRPWQCSSYIAGNPPPQPDYIFDAARGRTLADILIALAQAEADSPEDADSEAGAADADPGAEADGADAGGKPAAPLTPVRRLLLDLPPLDLPAHFTGLMTTLRNRRPALASRLERPLATVAPLLRTWSDLPLSLAHGDFHPLNVIWRDAPDEAGVAAVIDWEFCGPRPALYDAASCIGCVGLENPDAFGSGLIPALLGRLRQAGLFDPNDAPHLAKMVLILRFGWISEWLRAHDEDMLDLELDYLDLLARDQKAMARAWGE